MPGFGGFAAGLGGIGQGFGSGYDQALQIAANQALGRAFMPGGGMQPIPQYSPPPPPPPQVPNPQGSPPAGYSGPGIPPQPTPLQTMGGDPGSPGMGGPQPGSPSIPVSGPPVAQGGGGGGGYPWQQQPPPMQNPMQRQGGGPQGWGGGGGGIDINAIAQQIAQANPGIPPQVLAAAVQMYIKNMGPMIQEQRLNQMMQIAQMRDYRAGAGQELKLRIAQMNDATRQELVRLGLITKEDIAEALIGERHYEAGVRADTAEKGRITKEELAKMSDVTKRELAENGIIAKEDIAAANIAQRDRAIQQRAETAAAAEKGRDERAGAAQTEKAREFDIGNSRKAANDAIRQDQGWQRIALQRQGLTERIREADRRGDSKTRDQLIATWRTLLDAQHKRTTEIIQAYSVNNALPPKVTKQLVDDANKALDDEIKGLKIGGQPPT